MKKSNIGLLASVTLATAVLLTAIFGFGCYNGDYLIKEQMTRTIECKKDEGVYYDFAKTKKCIKPEGYEELYTLYNYWRLSFLAQRDNDKPIEMQLNMRRWFTVDELNKLMTDKRISLVTMVEIKTPGMTYHMYSSSTTVAGSAMAGTQNEIKQWKRRQAEGTLTDVAPKEIVSLSNGDYKASIIRVIAKPTDMAAFWEEHLDSLRFVQSYSAEYDKIQSPFHPEQAADTWIK